MVFNAPSRLIRLCAIRAFALAAIAAVWTGTAAATPASAASPQVRSTNTFIRTVMAEAADRSRTFRRLIETIEGTDGIVYVESGTCGHGVRSCLMLSVTRAGPYRILRIVVDTRQKPPELMGSIGHELRHAIEVLENRALVDAATLYLFYSQGRVDDGRAFETSPAIEAGFAVLNEIGASGR